MKHMTALKTLPLFKDMITQLVTYQTNETLKKTIS